MLVPIYKLKNIPLFSSQTLAELGQLGKPIVDPDKLQVIAFFLERCSGYVGFSPAVVLTKDIKEVSKSGATVDSIDKIVNPNDVKRLKQIIDSKFDLTKLGVIGKCKSIQGSMNTSVSSYAVDLPDFMIQQVRLANGGGALRKEIVEVNNEIIVINHTGRALGLTKLPEKWL